MQQTKGLYSEEVRLVESRNRMGETPLLRAMVTGVNIVIKVGVRTPCAFVGYVGYFTIFFMRSLLHCSHLSDYSPVLPIPCRRR